MYKQHFILAIAVLLTAFLFTGLNAQAASVKERMLARVPAINSLKDKGLVGENNRGYLEYRTDAKPEQKMISDENNDRKAVYADIAGKQNVDITLVGQRRANQIRDIGGAGQWFQKPDGAWYKK